VGVVLHLLEAPGRVERRDDLGVGVLHEPVVERRDVGVEVGGGVDRVQEGKAFVLTDLTVDLAEGRREVHDAGAVVDGHEVGRDHAPGVGVGRDREMVEGTLVVHSDEVTDRHRPKNLSIVSEHRADA
jgi:hypothetical protein